MFLRLIRGGGIKKIYVNNLNLAKNSGKLQNLIPGVLFHNKK